MSKQRYQIILLSIFSLVQSAENSFLAPLFGHLSQSDKFSEIKQPLDMFEDFLFQKRRRTFKHFDF